MIIALTVTVMTPLLYYLPMAALSSVVLFGVYFMMYFGEAWRLLKLFSLDFVLWATSCVVTVAWGAMEGMSQYNKHTQRTNRHAYTVYDDIIYIHVNHRSYLYTVYICI